VEKLKNQLLRSIVLLGLLLVLPVWGGAEAATASGSCGSNLRWTLDDAGLLTITGSGSMGSYSRSSVPWASYRGQIKAVEVGDGVTTISADAFYECDQIKTIRLPETLTAIGNHAFGFCQKLDGITIPAGVKTIPEGAFWACSKLKEVNLPDGLTRIGKDAFYSCRLLRTVDIPETVTSLGENAFWDCYTLQTVTIPEGVTEIPEDLFLGCQELTHVTLPPVITSIGSGAFAYCYALEELDLPDTVHSLGDTSFYLCYALEELTIPGSVSFIDRACFSTSGLKSVHFTGAAPEVGGYPFADVTATVFYPADDPTWTEDVQEEMSGDLAWFAWGAGGVEASGACGDELEWCVAGDVLTISGSGLMEDYTGSRPAPWYRLGDFIRHIEIGEGVTGIGDNAFSGLNGVARVELPATLETIGAKAFAACGIRQLQFYGDAPFFAEDAFSGRTGPELHYPAGGAGWDSVAGQGYGGTLSWTAYDSCGDSHSFLTWTVKTAPGCESCGVETSVCADCGVESRRTVPAAGHRFEDSEAIDPACTERGYTKHTCADCGEFYMDDYVPAEGHSWDSGNANSWETVYTCLVCGERRVEYSISGSCGSGVRWRLDSSDTLTISGSGAMSSGCPWKSYKDQIKRVVIESGVTSIGAEAFWECGSIESIEIPDTVRSIGMQAFVWCRSLRSVVVPEGVTAIHESTFWGCESLEELVLPSTLKTIGVDIFYRCNNLKKVIIPEGVTSIGDTAFWDSGVEEVIMPDTVTQIGESVFSSCSSLKKVRLSEKLTELPYSTFAYCASLESVTIPSGVQLLGDTVFYLCSSLRNVTVPGTVTSIGWAAFAGCSSLVSVRFTGNPPAFEEETFKDAAFTAYYPSGNSNWTYSVRQNYGGSVSWKSYGQNGVTGSGNCGGGLFWKMEGSTLVITGNGTMTSYTTAPWYGMRDQIHAVVLPEGMVAIGSRAFAGLYELEHITIPATVTSIGEGAFSGCGKLESIYFAGSAPTIYWNAFSGVTAEVSCPGHDGSWTAANRKNYEGSLKWTTRSAPCASHSFGDWETVLPASCIDKGLFLRICELCGAQESRRGTAAGHAYGITVVPPACTADGYTRHTCAVCGDQYEDSYVSALDHAWNEGHGSSTYWTYTCTRCGETKTVYFVSGSCGSNVRWKLNTETGILTISGSGSMSSGCPWKSYKDQIKTVIIESGVTSIGAEAFWECGSIESIEIPATVRSIGMQAFVWCRALKSVVVPEGVTSIQQSTFWGCESLETLVLPSTLRTMGDDLFYRCEKLTKVTVPEGVTSIGETAFWDSGVTEVHLPSTLTRLGRSAFSSCSNLRTVNLPDGLTRLENSTFSGCKALKTLTLPANLEFIGDSVFSGCGGLTTLTIPRKVSHVGGYAFSSSGIRTLRFTGNAPEFDEETFERDMWISCYYPGYNGTWTESVRQKYGGYPTWIADYNCTHSYDITEVTPPTCVDLGYTTYICSQCGASYVDDYVAATGEHSYEPEIIAPTCTEQGYTLYTCFPCGSSYMSDLTDPLGHEEIIFPAIPPTCTEMGWSEGKMCERCGEILAEQELLDVLPHDFETVVTPPTCTEQGYTIYTCRNCGICYPDDYVDPLDHSWDEGVVTLEPTEETEGTRLYTCTACGETRTETIPRLDHVHRYTSVVTAPTCTEQGYTTHTCPCGDSYVDSYVAALGHDEVVVPAVPPTCTESGLNEGEHCARCGEVLVVQTEVPATGHGYESVVTAPTCTEQGYTTYTCTACGDSYVADYVAALGHDEVVVPAVPPTCTESGLNEGKHCARCGEVLVARTEIPATGHGYEAAVTAPTCTEQGYTTYTCIVCGDSYVSDYVSAVGHSWDKGVVTLEPTEETEGTRLYTCTACGEARTETIPRLDHVHRYTSVVTAPTCTEQGYTTHTCPCGESYVDSYVAALGHDEVVDPAVPPTCTESGLSEGRHCQRCGEVLAKQTEVPATGHTCENGFCTSCGEDFAAATESGDSLSVYLPGLSEDARVVVAAYDGERLTECHVEEHPQETMAFARPDGELRVFVLDGHGRPLRPPVTA